MAEFYSLQKLAKIFSKSFTKLIKTGFDTKKLVDRL